MDIRSTPRTRGTAGVSERPEPRPGFRPVPHWTISAPPPRSAGAASCTKMQPTRSSARDPSMPR